MDIHLSDPEFFDSLDKIKNKHIQASKRSLDTLRKVIKRAKTIKDIANSGYSNIFLKNEDGPEITKRFPQKDIYSVTIDKFILFISPDGNRCIFLAIFYLPAFRSAQDKMLKAIFGIDPEED